MSGLFSKLFGLKKKDSNPVKSLIEATVEGLLERSSLELEFNVHGDEETVVVELKGNDEELLKENDGQMIDALQLFIQRVVQHNFPEDRTNITIDCNGFREASNQALVDLAEKLKGQALEKGKSVYFRALPPKDRKVIHQYLSADARVKSRSIGDGLYKKIKIYPVKGNSVEEKTTNS